METPFSGVLGLVAGAVGIAFPAALPVAAIAGIISMAAHGVMAVLQSILVGHNVIRLRAATTPDERAKILPTLYRDISKLIFAVVGVALGGVGTGLATAHGVMSTAALGGSDLGGHIGTLVSENVAEGAAGTAMFYTIAKQNFNEGELGAGGAYDQDLAHGHGADSHDAGSNAHDLGASHGPDAPTTTHTTTSAPESVSTPQTGTSAHSESSPTPSPTSPGPTSETTPSSGPNVEDLVEDATQTRQDVSQGIGATTEMGAALDSQRGLVGGIDQVTDARQQLVQATQGLNDNDTSARENVDGHPEREQENKAALTTAEQGIKEANSLDGQQTQTRPRATAPTSRRPTGVQTKRVQRAPGWFSRFTGWVKKKIAGLFGRFKGAVAALKSKLTAMAMKLMGIDKLKGDLGAGLGEQQQRVEATRGALTDTNAAAEEYASGTAQLRDLAKSSSSSSPQ